MRVAGVLRSAEQIQTEGVNRFLADWAAAGQENSHVHLRVIPGVVGDVVTFATKCATPGREALDDLAGEIAEQLWRVTTCRQRSV